jgi:hypothetical protein
VADPNVAAWDAWEPSVVADRLAGLTVPWCVAAGWAIDLFLGTRTRAHSDLEIALPAGRFDEVAPRFDDGEFWVIDDHEVFPATPASLELTHQTWLKERATGAWRLDIFREPHDGDVWICRRDPRIRRPYADIIAFTADGVPYLAPEIVLLFKAKAAREKDEADLRNVLPHLDDDARQWLDDALAVAHPEHPWRALLS